MAQASLFCLPLSDLGTPRSAPSLLRRGSISSSGGVLSALMSPPDLTPSVLFALFLLAKSLYSVDCFVEHFLVCGSRLPSLRTEYVRGKRHEQAAL